jgi:hypothetical protein
VTGTRTRPPIGRWLRYAFFGTLLAASVFVAAQGGAERIYLGLAVGSAAVGGLIGFGKVLFGTGTTRDGEAIVCRYVPWLEGTCYVLPMFVAFGITAIGLGGRPGYPGFSRYIGIGLLALTPLGLLAMARLRRLSVLRITPEAITVQAPGRPYPSQLFRSQPVEITRGSVEAVASKFTPMAAQIAHEVQITYRTNDSEAPKTWVFGPPSPCQLTVEPGNLLTALQIWKAADEGVPGLMSRLEPILSSRTPVGG